jgi:DNA-binding IclR family transcriptional regulator
MLKKSKSHQALAKKKPAANRKLVSTLERGLRVLAAFHVNDKRPLTNRELATRTKLHKATVSRLTLTLVDLGYLERDPRTEGFNLGSGVLRLSHAYLTRIDIRAIARPFMQQLANEASGIVALSTRSRGHIITIETVTAETPFHFRVAVGSQVPLLGTAIGHAYLSAMHAEAREALLARLAQNKPKDWDDILARMQRDIAAIERNGFCVSVGEWRSQFYGVAVPLRVGEDIFAIGLAGLVENSNQKTLAALGKNMLAASKAIERVVGQP